MSDALKLFLAGVFVGLFIAVMLNALPASNSSRYRAAIAECEKTLPRDQHCVVIGVKP